VHGLRKFSLIKGVRAVIISDLELSAKRRDTTGTSSRDLFADMLDDSLLTGILGNTLGGLLGSTGPATLGGTRLRSVEDIVISLGSGLTSHISTPALLSHALLRLVGELPGIFHHELEVHVIIDANRDVAVVLVELLLGDNVVRSLVLTHGVSSLEGLKEFLKDLFLGLLALLNRRMVGSVVDITDVVDINPTIAILVKLLESLGDDSLTLRVHRATDGTKELVVRALTIVIDIEVVEENADLTLREVQLEVVHGLGELVLVEGLRVIIIHDLELSLETDNATSAAGCKFLLELHGEGLRILRGSTSLATKLGRSSRGRSAKDGRGEFLVVNGAGAVHIVDAEEHLKITSGGDMDADLFDGLGEFVGLDNAVIIQVEVLERLHEDGLLGLGAACLLRQLVFQFSLETGFEVFHFSFGN